jgi:hypothetical protein
VAFLDKIQDRVGDFTEEIAKQLDAHRESIGATDAYSIRQVPLTHIHFQFSDLKQQQRFNLI